MAQLMRATATFGFDPDFLAVRVPLPRPDEDRMAHELAYTHFTVLLDPRRRLAAVTGVNIDGRELRDVARTDDWRLDPRVAATDQAGPELYTNNDLDRGHLVRRRDPVWGEPAVAERANEDTFHYTNAAPQAAGFNQSRELWLGLEDHILEHARAHQLRLNVFTGPVLADHDPTYRGVQIPRLFWKIAVWAATGHDGRARLAAAAFILDQSPQLEGIELMRALARAAEADEPPPLGPFRTFQVPVADIAELTEVDVGDLVAADRFPEPSVAASAGRWTVLTDLAAVRL